MILTIGIRISTGWRTHSFLGLASAKTVNLEPFPDRFPCGKLEEIRDVQSVCFDFVRGDLVIGLESFNLGIGFLPVGYFSPEQIDVIVAYLRDNGWKETLWPPKED